MTEPSACTSLKLLVKNRKALKNCLCITMLFLVSELFYFGMLGTMERTGYNFWISMLISAGHEALGFLVSILFMSKIGKKKRLFICTIAMIVCALLFILQAVQKSDVAQSILIFFLSFFNVFISAYLAIMEMEAFSTEMRTIALGISSGLSDGVVLVQPFIVNWVNGLGFHPAIFCAGVAIVFGIFPIFLIQR